MRKQARGKLFLLVFLAVLLTLPLAGCGTKNQAASIKTLSEIKKLPEYTPLWTDPLQKLKSTSSPDFTKLLYLEAQAYEPLIAKPQTQVSMGYWSGPGNHGSLVRVLDSINAQQASASVPTPKALWDEGATSSNQYPSYDTMLREHWYERANPANGKVTIYGIKYKDPYPVTMQQADSIWGQQSRRYADMAELIFKVTGKPVNAWCFVQGAKANRVFYKNELPELQKLEKEGAVKVFFAKTQDADWQNPADWIEGTANAPAPAPAQ